MAARLALSSLRAAAARPHPFARIPLASHARTFASSSSSSTPQSPQPPAERAAELIDKLPSSPNIITKTGTAILGSGLLAAAISQELYVMNEESVVALGSLILFGYLAKILREPYRDWANGHINRIKGVLDSSRAEHTQAVKDRISSVQEMKDVVTLTESLFALSKSTAHLESEAFVQQQKVALASELRSVLDSWVRFEQQAKENEHAALVRSIIDRVQAGLSDERTQREILAAAIAEIELMVKNKAI